MKLIIGQPVEIAYRLRDLGHGTEEGRLHGQFSYRDVDTWGKHTFWQTRGGPAYLFPDEILSCTLIEHADDKANSTTAGGED